MIPAKISNKINTDEKKILDNVSTISSQTQENFQNKIYYDF